MAAQQHLSRGADDQVGEGGGGGARGATTQRQRVRARRLRRGAEAGLRRDDEEREDAEVDEARVGRIARP